MDIKEDVLERIKVDERNDALPKFLDKISRGFEAKEGKHGLEEHMRKALVVHGRLLESSANIAQTKETISETSFTIVRSSRDLASAPANTVAIVVDVRKRGSCRVFNAKKYLGGADAINTQKVVVMPWHNT
jgi:hypothetical protein